MPSPKARISLDDLLAELERTTVYHGHVSDHTGKHLYGLCDYRRDAIFVNEQYGAVDTAIHELLHRKFPRRSEARILRDTAQILKGMSRSDIAKFYRKYSRVKRASVPVEAEC